MYERYGGFAQIVSALDKAQGQARVAWNDRTAASYDTLNDNVKTCAGRIWVHYTDSVAGTNGVKSNYDSEAMDRYLALLGRKVEEA